MFEIYLSNAALKALKDLDKRIVEKAKKALLALKTSPLPIKEYDIKKVEGAEDIYRLRISIAILQGVNPVSSFLLAVLSIAEASVSDITLKLNKDNSACARR